MTETTRSDGSTTPTADASAGSAGAEAGQGPRRLPSTTDMSAAARDARRERLRADGHAIDHLCGDRPQPDPAGLAGSIEGFIGFAQVPLGVAGPLRIRGEHAQGDFMIPLATSEGTLVASFQHAFNVMNRCGGAATACTQAQTTRAPCFSFADIATAAAFARWLPGQSEAMREAAASTSRFCRLRGMRSSVVGNTVFVVLEYSTGDAAGQNMVTLATQAVCERLLAQAPAAPASWLVESGLSGDKRPSAHAFLGARGRNASAEVVVPARAIGRYWRADVDAMVSCWDQARASAAQLGSVGLQGNVPNAIAALFIACGQDVACVSEAATAITRMERLPSGDLYASVTLPNLIVGTVGGGTYLPTARECLAMLGCTGEGSASRFAEICAAVVLAGELSVVGAMASGAFAGAHAAGGRKGRTSASNPSPAA